jgi:hypothetical protein
VDEGQELEENGFDPKEERECHLKIFLIDGKKTYGSYWTQWRKRQKNWWTRGMLKGLW